MLFTIMICIAPAGGAEPVTAPVLPALVEPAPIPNRAEFGKNLPRTMALLAQSTPERRWPVKIMLYGQSITVQPWWRTVAADVQGRFPHAEIHFNNLAIGGYGFHLLRRTAEHDIYPNYPDLILLQAYAARDGNLEALVADIRRRTTAEIMLCTHHVCIPVRRAEMDDEAHAQAYDAHQRNRAEECDEIRRVAEKYGCELVEVRTPWERYLQDNNLAAQEFLEDHIHLNDNGNALMAALIGPHFQYVPGSENPWSDCIEIRPVQADHDGHIRVSFTGNRIDVIASAAPAGVQPASATVLIDGKAPAEDPMLYAITRPSQSPHAWYPAVNRIGHTSPLLVEDWTMLFTRVSEDGSDIDYEVVGSKTGPDGTGTSKSPFASGSGRVVIDEKDFSVAQALKWFKQPMPDNFRVTWSVVPQFVGTYHPAPGAGKGLIQVTTLAQGLTNGRHTLELIPQGEGNLAIDSVRIHRPPGADEAAE
jgi:hypothetical protein